MRHHAAARAIETVGHEAPREAIIVLHPAKPPMVMHDTLRVSAAVEAVIAGAVENTAGEVAQYVPGYRLRQQVRCSTATQNDSQRLLIGAADATLIDLVLDVRR